MGIFLVNEIINYLKLIYFEIVKMDCFEFDSIPTKNDHVHLFFGAEPKYFILRVVQII